MYVTLLLLPGQAVVSYLVAAYAVYIIDSLAFATQVVWAWDVYCDVIDPFVTLNRINSLLRMSTRVEWIKEKNGKW